MRWTTHFIAITLGVLMAPAATFGQPQQGQQGNRNSGFQGRRVSEQHDNLSNADYTTSMDSNGNALFTVKAGDFLLEKALNSSGSFTLRLSQGKDVVSVVSDSSGYVVTRGKRTARLDIRGTNQEEARDAVRAVLLGSQAIRSFRRLGVLLENREEGDEESPVMLNTLMDGALVQMLDGDSGAMPRIATRAVRKQRARLRVVKLPEMFRDCVGLYEASLLDSWNQYMSCLDWAYGVTWWLSRWAAEICHWEFFLRSQQYIWQFVSCFALPV